MSCVHSTVFSPFSAGLRHFVQAGKTHLNVWSALKWDTSTCSVLYISSHPSGVRLWFSCVFELLTLRPSVTVCRLVTANSSFGSWSLLCLQWNPTSCCVKAAAVCGSWAGYQFELLSWTEWDYVERPSSPVSGSLLHLGTWSWRTWR